MEEPFTVDPAKEYTYKLPGSGNQDEVMPG